MCSFSCLWSSMRVRSKIGWVEVLVGSWFIWLHHLPLYLEFGIWQGHLMLKICLTFIECNLLRCERLEESFQNFHLLRCWESILLKLLIFTYFVQLSHSSVQISIFCPKYLPLSYPPVPTTWIPQSLSTNTLYQSLWIMIQSRHLRFIDFWLSWDIKHWTLFSNQIKWRWECY